MWWQPNNFKKRLPALKQRIKLIRTIRDYFDRQDFLEVETPILQVSPVMDMHIHAMKTEVLGVDLKHQRDLYLHTSPEFAMKKLMVAGLPKLYQICHVFRNAEGSRLHSPEFTMIEWYRAPGDYNHIMDDCVGLIRSCAEALGALTLSHGDISCDPFQDWEKISVTEAFRQYADIDLEKYLDDTDGLRNAVKGLGLHAADDDKWDDLFFRVMADKIEPYLGQGAPTFLYDYPASMASLSRKKPTDPRYAERFELYICGLEIANAFSELTDAEEQRKRFNEEMAMKKELYGEPYPVDEDFLQALEYGFPESGGIALGVDRLCMVLLGLDDIQDAVWCSV